MIFIPLETLREFAKSSNRTLRGLANFIILTAGAAAGGALLAKILEL